MKNALWAVGLSVTMGLMMGCGGGIADESMQQSPESSELASREDALPDCSNGGSYTAFFSDASYTNEIGGRGCSCGAYVSWGKTSTFRQTSFDPCF
jgi:hypothetical protein